MNFLWRLNSHFNLANLFTMVNISAGLIATYFISIHSFIIAIIFTWIGGFFDIFDGKIARKYKLSNEFGVQLDSFADFLSFVLVPIFLIFEAVYLKLNGVIFLVASLVSIYYVISGLRRLIEFNINTNSGEIDKFFTGVPTPLGAILLWLTYLADNYTLISSITAIFFMIVIAWSLNSKIKIPHP